MICNFPTLAHFHTLIRRMAGFTCTFVFSRPHLCIYSALLLTSPPAHSLQERELAFCFISYVSVEVKEIVL